MLALPKYKVLLDFEGLPPHIYKEQEVINAVRTFGTFLGSVDQSDPSDISRWTAAVAVDRLERIPDEVIIHKGGFKYPAVISIKNWLRAPLFSTADLPRAKPKYNKQSLTPASIQNRRPEPFCVSGRVLLELCKDRDFASLPPGYKRSSEKSLASPRRRKPPPHRRNQWLSFVVLSQNSQTLLSMRRVTMKET